MNFLDRLKEGSTWAGFAGILQALKYFINPAMAGYIDAVTMGAGAIAAALPDRGTTNATSTSGK